jgi:hypothetical protein
MELIRKNFAVVGIVVIVVLAATLYVLMSGGSTTAVETTEGGALVAVQGADIEAQDDPDVLKLLLEMRAIKLDGRLFTSPAFRVLQDTGKEVIKEPQGRNNPFSPTGSDELSDVSGDDAEETTSRPAQQAAPRDAQSQQRGIRVPSNIPQFTE